jgi:hypothetical protein
MRFFTSVSVLFLISAALGAADPFVGIWKLNVRNPTSATRPQPRAAAPLMKPPGRDIRMLRQTCLGKTRLNVCKFLLSLMEQRTKDVLGAERLLLSQGRSTTTATNSYSRIKKPVKLRRHFGTRFRRKVTPSRSFR